MPKPTTDKERKEENYKLQADPIGEVTFNGIVYVPKLSHNKDLVSKIEAGFNTVAGIYNTSKTEDYKELTLELKRYIINLITQEKL